MESKELFGAMQHSGAFRYALTSGRYNKLSPKNKIDLALNKTLMSFYLLPVADRYKKYKKLLNIREKKLVKKLADELALQEGTDTVYLQKCLRELSIDPLDPALIDFV